MNKQELLSKVEHTILKADTGLDDIAAVVSEASEFGCRGACIPPLFAKHALEYREYNELDCLLISVAGFPFAYHSEKVVWTEIREMLREGIDEVDVVGPLYLVKGGYWDEVRRVIGLYREAAGDAVLKVIMETGFLNPDEIKRYCEILSECKVDFAKTSTGFAGGGATVEAVRLMRASLAPEVKIKASGGIRSIDAMRALLDAGADVLGMSQAIKLLNEEDASS